MKTLKFKTVGFFSFKTKRVYKTSAAKRAAETKFAAKVKDKINWAIIVAKRELKSYKNYIAELISTTKASFKRWSEIMTINALMKEVKREVPKQYRHLVA
jgi:hypothetical protein